MIHATPTPNAAIRRLLARLDELHDRLRAEASVPRPWAEALRRDAQVDSVTSSASIEGYVVEEALAPSLVAGVRAPGSDESQQAIAGYARAMQHVAIMSDDPEFGWSKRVLLDLHFDACGFQRDSSPGRWRAGPVYVTGADGSVQYTAPVAQDVPALMDEVVEWLDGGDLDAHHALRAAMAHLHVVSVHPFRDGNGRVSRIVQSLVLARAGILAPALGSIEPYLARNTAAYYAQLQQTHGATYDPTLDVRRWIEFCLEAHVEEASRRIHLYELAAHRWSVLEQYVSGRGWPERLVIALERALIGGLDRAGYVAEAEISAPTASLDFRLLQGAELIQPVGRGRMTSYTATRRLGDLVRKGAPEPSS